MENKKRILLVEDDQNLAYLLREQFVEHQYKTTVCTTASSGLEAYKERHFDLCIFDVKLPDFDGFKLAKRVKRIDSSAPLLFLTSRNLKQDLLKGYSIGADDYVPKPFDLDLLMVKIRAILNRCVLNNLPSEEVLELSGAQLDVLNKCISVNNKEHHLSNTDLELITLFFTEYNQPISRNRILKEIWGRSDQYVSGSLDVYINRIRKILNNHSSLTLATIHSYGYILKTV
jgi:DNA-binding response OmpR family regulator